MAMRTSLAESDPKVRNESRRMEKTIVQESAYCDAIHGKILSPVNPEGKTLRRSQDS